MKQKIISLIISSAFIIGFSVNAHAIDLGGVLKEVAKDNKSVQNIANIDKKIDQAIGGVKKDVLNKVNGEIKKVTDKVEKETAKVTKIIDEAQEGINLFNKIKNNIQKYIKIAKIIGWVLGSGILLILFLLWKVWRNIVSFKKIAKNVANYNDIKKQLDALEAKVAKLEAAKK